MRPQNEVLWELRTNSDDRHQTRENIKFFLLRCANLGGKRAKHVIPCDCSPHENEDLVVALQNAIQVDDVGM